MDTKDNKVIVLYPVEASNPICLERHTFDYMESSEIVEKLKPIKERLHTSGKPPLGVDEINDFDDNALEVLFDGDEQKMREIEIELAYAFGLSPEDSIKNYWAVEISADDLHKLA